MLVVLSASGVTLSPRAGEIDWPRVRDELASSRWLDWQNVTSRNGWVSGAEPVYRWGKGCSTVLLGPGESTVVRLAAGEDLAVYAWGHALSASDLSVSRSEGSRLFVPAHWSSKSRPDCLDYESTGRSARHVRVEAAGVAGRPEIGLFVLRRPAVPEVEPFRELALDGLAAARIRDGREPAGKRYHRVPEDRPVTIPVAGVRRVAVVTRLAYPDSESRIDQRYRVTLSGAGGYEEVVTHDTSADFRGLLRAGGEPRALGERRVAYAAIPPGLSELALSVSAPVFARVLVETENAYLLPWMNGPSSRPQQPSRISEALAERSRSFFERALHGRSPAAESSGRGGLDAAAAAALVRNDLFEGAGRAREALRRIAESLGGSPEIWRQVDRLARYRGAFIDLLPERKTVDGEQAFLWFVGGSAALPTARRYVVHEVHGRDLLGRLGRGRFLPLARSRRDAPSYRLPVRTDPHRLRLLLAGPERLPDDTRVFVQYDDAPPIGLPVSSLDAERAVRSRGEAGLTLAGATHGTVEALGVSGPHGWRLTTGPVVRADVAELEAPPRVDTVRIWTEARAPRGCGIALQSRSSGNHRPSEMEHLAARRAVERGIGVWDWFVESLVQYEQGSGPASPDEAVLRNHWLPLIRALREAEKSFLAAAGGWAPHRAARGRFASGVLDPLRERAREHESRGDWISALATWSRVIAAGGRDGEIAELGRVRALLALDESGLAEGILESLIAGRASERFRRECVDYLASIHRGRGDGPALRRLYMAVFSMEPGPEYARELVRSLVDDGEPGFALLLAAALPRSERPAEATLRAALGGEWWRTFDATLGDLDDAGARAYWAGHRLLARGRYAESAAAFREAGERGEAFAASIREALSIREQLEIADRTVRLQAVRRWEEWTRKMPGPRVWDEDRSLVVDYAGTEAVYSLVRNRSAVYYRPSRDRPVLIRIVGPARLRIESRVLHRQSAKYGQRGWLRVEGTEWVRHVPLRSRVLSRGLVLEGGGPWRPGYRHATEIDVGIGLHEYRVFEVDVPVLVRAVVERPELPIGALPPLSPATVRAALDGGFRRGPEAGGGAGMELTVLSSERASAAVEVPFVEAARRGIGVDPPDLSGLPGDIACGWAIRLGVRIDAFADAVGRRFEGSGFPPEEKLRLLAAEGRLGDALRRPSEYGGLEVPESLREGVLLHHGEYGAVLDLPRPSDEESLARRLESLNWVAEHVPEHRRRAWCLGEAICSGRRGGTGTRRLHSRLTAGLTWRKMLETSGGAGLRYVPIRGWVPETRTLRIRKALLTELDDHEQVVAGGGSIVLAVSGERSRILRVVLTLEQLDFGTPAPMTVFYRVDDEEPASVELTRRNPRLVVDVALPLGDHRLSVWVRDRTSYQYLRVGFLEAFDSARSEVGEGGVPVVREIRREYLVATAGQPLVFEVPGPAWLRVDELRDGAVLSAYRHVTGRQETLVLRPEADRDEGLFRVFERAEGRDPPPEELEDDHPAIRPLDDVPTELPEPDGPAVEPVEGFGDEVWPGGLRLDTWSYGGSFVRKKALEEDARGALKPDQYFEATATHRFHRERLGAHFRTSFLTRIHDEGGPTLGFRERFRIEPPDWGELAFFGDARFFLQWPSGAEFEPEGGPEWSGTLRGGVTQRWEISDRFVHRPSLEVFGRTFSIEEGSPEALLVTDQNVFTTYKSRHRAGLELSETIHYRPWLDTRASLRLSFSTNEDFDPSSPDNAGFRLGIDQRLGSAEIGARFRVTQYFDDGDRQSSFRRHVVSIRARKDFWLRPSRRIELTGGWSFDIERSDSTFFFGLIVHFGDRSGYRDFASDELGFRGLRKRSMYGTFRADG